MRKNFPIAFVIFAIISILFCSCSSSTLDDNTSLTVSSNLDTTITSTSASTTVDTTENTSSEISTTNTSIAEENIPIDKLPEEILELKEIFEELPNFDTVYEEASLPIAIIDSLDISGECTVNAFSTSIHFWYNKHSSDSPIFAETSVRSIIFKNPILYYDTRKFYLKGIADDDGSIYIYCLDDYSLSISSDDGDEAVDETNLISFPYWTPTSFTIKEVNDNDILISRYGDTENYVFENIHADLKQIPVNTPFIDLNDNLVQLQVNSKNIDFKIIEEDVKCSLYEEFYDTSASLICQLYEKNDGTYFVYGYNNSYNEFYTKTKLYSGDSLNMFFLVDDFNRCYLCIVISISDSSVTTLDEYVCYIPEDKLHNEKVQEILTSHFNYTDKVSKIDELLSYINS